jgi:hypothetical protein
LVRVSDHDQARPSDRGRDELEQLELGRVDVLELVDEDQPELGPQLLSQR